MDEDNYALRSKHKVWSAGQFPPVKAVPVTHSVNDAPNRHLGTHAMAADLGHVPRPAFFRNLVYHEHLTLFHGTMTLHTSYMARAKTFKLGHIAEKALGLLKDHPEGLSMAQMRDMLNANAETQEHFNRRVREIRNLYDLDRTVTDRVSIYTLGKEREAPTADSGQLSEKLRAAVMHAAHGRCQMCGRTIAEDEIKLQADHRIPQSWGGPTDLDNLWAICEACNRGKRNYFSSFDDEEMKQVVNLDSVHERIARFLKLHMPDPVPSYAIEFIANAKDQQLDWRKRLRELRYDPIGLNIEVSKKKDDKGVQSFYALRNWRELPPDHVRLIKEFERNKNRR